MRPKGLTGLSARYLLVSAAALALDYSIAWSLSLMGVWVPAAASLGYLMGLVLAFPFMRASVFRFGGRGLERMPLYLASGAVGILATYLTTLAMSESLGQGFHLSKIVASGLSFITVFFFRYFWVFRVRP